MSRFPQPQFNERRNFFKTAAMLAPVAVGSVLAAQSSPAVAAESHEPGTYTPPFKVFRSIQKHENDHVTFLEMALGAEARPAPTFKGLAQTKYADFVRLARVFENTGVAAYLGAAPYISSPDILSAAASIATVEARHAGVLNTFINLNITLNNESFDHDFTPGQVRYGVEPFISSLNGGPPVTYSFTSSEQNDINILNFALALEYLEAEFYNINVPRFFPQIATSAADEASN